jgi:hypothetical protein
MTRRRNPRPTGPVPDEPRLRLREPVDVLAAIPYLVGYHPAESMVLLGMRGKQLTFTARLDLPSVDASRQDVRDTIDHMLQVVLRQRLTGVLIVGFGPDERVRPLAHALRGVYATAGLDVLEALRAEDGRYWSYLCTDPLCCPEDGSPYDPEASAVAAEWTVAGRVALPDREAYEQQLKPVGGIARVSVRQATARADDRLTELLARPVDEESAAAAMMTAGHLAIDSALARLRAGEQLSDDDVAWLSVIVSSLDLRDIAWIRIRGSGDELPLHRTLWMEVLRRAEPDLTSAPGCLFAFAAWRCGEGALARIALDRVLGDDPDYSMARLLHHILVHGLPPTAFDNLPVSRVRRRPARGRRKRSSSRRAGSRRG